MSIVVADNFQYKGGKPLDARMKFSTILDMTSTPAADLYDGCFAYVTGTKKYYSYDSSNETDPSLGKWKEYSAGAEYSDFTGATSQEAGAHGLVPAPTTGDISKFLKGDGTWATVPMPSFDYSNTSPEAMNFSTDEKVIGTWIDGKPLYQKTVDCGALPNSSNKSIPYNINNVERFVHVEGVYYDTSDPKLAGFLPRVHHINVNNQVFIDTRNGNIFLATASDQSSSSAYVTLRYTKTTDTAVASGEKIVGQWIDGKPLYEKTVSCGTLPNNTTKTVAHGISNLDGVKTVFGYGYRSSDDTSIFFPDNSLLAVWIKGDDIYLSDTADRSSYTESYVTLRYTKTTD